MTRRTKSIRCTTSSWTDTPSSSFHHHPLVSSFHPYPPWKGSTSPNPLAQPLVKTPILSLTTLIVMETGYENTSTHQGLVYESPPESSHPSHSFTFLIPLYTQPSTDQLKMYRGPTSNDPSGITPHAGYTPTPSRLNPSFPSRLSGQIPAGLSRGGKRKHSLSLAQGRGTMSMPTSPLGQSVNDEIFPWDQGVSLGLSPSSLLLSLLVSFPPCLFPFFI
jgi:hypothetical protein